MNGSVQTAYLLLGEDIERYHRSCAVFRSVHCTCVRLNGTWSWELNMYFSVLMHTAVRWTQDMAIFQFEIQKYRFFQTCDVWNMTFETRTYASTKYYVETSINPDSASVKRTINRFGAARYIKYYLNCGQRWTSFQWTLNSSRWTSCKVCSSQRHTAQL